MKKLCVLLLMAVLCFGLSACDVAELMGGISDILDGGNDTPANEEVVGDQMIIGGGSDVSYGSSDWMPEGDEVTFGYITMEELQELVSNNEECMIEVIDDVIYINGLRLDTDGYEFDVGMLEQILRQEETEEPADGIVMPGGTIIPTHKFLESEDGLRYTERVGGSYWVIFPDDSIGHVTFVNADHQQVSRDQAEIIVVFVYVPNADDIILRHEEYRASDMVTILSTVYQHEEIDGALCYVSSETVEYSEYYGDFVTSKHEYDPTLGIHRPTKIYTFDTKGKPDGHYEMSYYPNGTTRESKGYYPDGTLSYVMIYNRSAVMIEHTMYREDGSLECIHTYDTNGEPLLATYYREDGSYWTVETLEGIDRYTHYDANGNVTSTEDVPN